MTEWLWHRERTEWKQGEVSSGRNLNSAAVTEKERWKLRQRERMKRVATTPKGQNDALHKELPLIHSLARPHRRVPPQQSNFVYTPNCLWPASSTASSSLPLLMQKKKRKKMKKAKKCLSAPSWMAQAMAEREKRQEIMPPPPLLFRPISLLIIFFSCCCCVAAKCGKRKSEKSLHFSPLKHS